MAATRKARLEVTAEAVLETSGDPLNAYLETSGDPLNAYLMVSLGERTIVIHKALEQAIADGARDVEAMKRVLRQTTARFVSERTKRRPMIVPVVIEV